MESVLNKPTDKISVIIISYNCAEYISEAIESCLSQSYKNIEIIIGDDGSTDSSNRIIEDYATMYPNTIKHYVMSRPHDESDIIPSIRVSANIRQAVKYATGRYICLLSADDYYMDDLLFEKEMYFLKKNNDYVSVACGYRKQWPNGKYEEMIHRGRISTLFWSGGYLHISCFLIKANVFHSKNFLPRLCDDTGMLYTIIASGKCKCLPFVGMVYRQREGSIMHKADRIELDLLELLLYQDIQNVGALPFSSMSRFARPINYIFSHRKELNKPQYKKYLKETSRLDKSIIKDIINYEKSTIVSKTQMIFFCGMCRILGLVTGLIRRINNHVI